MSKCHAALGLLAKMPALERLMLPSGCLNLRSTAALRQHEALSGRAFLPGSLDRPWHFVPEFALLGCCLDSLHILWGILHTSTVYDKTGSSNQPP